MDEQAHVASVADLGAVRSVFEHYGDRGELQPFLRHFRQGWASSCRHGGRYDAYGGEAAAPLLFPALFLPIPALLGVRAGMKGLVPSPG